MHGYSDMESFFLCSTLSFTRENIEFNTRREIQNLRTQSLLYLYYPLHESMHQFHNKSSNQLWFIQCMALFNLLNSWDLKLIIGNISHLLFCLQYFENRSPKLPSRFWRAKGTELRLSRHFNNTNSFSYKLTIPIWKSVITDLKSLLTQVLTLSKLRRYLTTAQHLSYFSISMGSDRIRIFSSIGMKRFVLTSLN